MAPAIIQLPAASANESNVQAGRLFPLMTGSDIREIDFATIAGLAQGQAPCTHTGLWADVLDGRDFTLVPAPGGETLRS